METKPLNRIKVVMAERMVFNKELSEMLHKDTATISRWVTNTSQPNLESLVENYEDEDSKVIIDYCKNNIGYFIEYKNLFSTWLLPDSSFTVADLSVALNSFIRLTTRLPKPTNNSPNW